MPQAYTSPTRALAIPTSPHSTMKPARPSQTSPRSRSSRAKINPPLSPEDVAGWIRDRNTATSPLLAQMVLDQHLDSRALAAMAPDFEMEDVASISGVLHNEHLAQDFLKVASPLLDRLPRADAVARDKLTLHEIVTVLSQQDSLPLSSIAPETTPPLSPTLSDWSFDEEIHGEHYEEFAPREGPVDDEDEEELFLLSARSPSSYHSAVGPRARLTTLLSHDTSFMAHDITLLSALEMSQPHRWSPAIRVEIAEEGHQYVHQTQAGVLSRHRETSRELEEGGAGPHQPPRGRTLTRPALEDDAQQSRWTPRRASCPPRPHLGEQPLLHTFIGHAPAPQRQFAEVMVQTDVQEEERPDPAPPAEDLLDLSSGPQDTDHGETNHVPPPSTSNTGDRADPLVQGGTPPAEPASPPAEPITPPRPATSTEQPSPPTGFRNRLPSASPSFIPVDLTRASSESRGARARRPSTLSRAQSSAHVRTASDSKVNPKSEQTKVAPVLSLPPSPKPSGDEKRTTRGQNAGRRGRGGRGGSRATTSKKRKSEPASQEHSRASSRVRASRNETTYEEQGTGAESTNNSAANVDPTKETEPAHGPVADGEQVDEADPIVAPPPPPQGVTEDTSSQSQGSETTKPSPAVEHAEGNSETSQQNASDGPVPGVTAPVMTSGEAAPTPASASTKPPTADKPPTSDEQPAAPQPPASDERQDAEEPSNSNEPQPSPANSDEAPSPSTAHKPSDPTPVTQPDEQEDAESREEQLASALSSSILEPPTKPSPTGSDKPLPPAPTDEVPTITVIPPVDEDDGFTHVNGSDGEGGEPWQDVSAAEAGEAKAREQEQQQAATNAAEAKLTQPAQEEKGKSKEESDAAPPTPAPAVSSSDPASQEVPQQQQQQDGGADETADNEAETMSMGTSEAGAAVGKNTKANRKKKQKKKKAQANGIGGETEPGTPIEGDQKRPEEQAKLDDKRQLDVQAKLDAQQRKQQEGKNKVDELTSQEKNKLADEQKKRKLEEGEAKKKREMEGQAHKRKEEEAAKAKRLEEQANIERDKKAALEEKIRLDREEAERKEKERQEKERQEKERQEKEEREREEREREEREREEREREEREREEKERKEKECEEREREKREREKREREEREREEKERKEKECEEREREKREREKREREEEEAAEAQQQQDIATKRKLVELEQSEQIARIARDRANLVWQEREGQHRIAVEAADAQRLDAMRRQHEELVRKAQMQAEQQVAQVRARDRAARASPQERLQALVQPDLEKQMPPQPRPVKPDPPKSGGGFFGGFAKLF